MPFGAGDAGGAEETTKASILTHWLLTYQLRTVCCSLVMTIWYLLLFVVNRMSLPPSYASCSGHTHYWLLAIAAHNRRSTFAAAHPWLLTIRCHHWLLTIECPGFRQMLRIPTGSHSNSLPWSHLSIGVLAIGYRLHRAAEHPLRFTIGCFLTVSALCVGAASDGT